jgi:ABC-2 type transport system permease protein
VFGKDVGLAKNGKYTNLARQILKSSVISELGSEQEAAILQKDPATKLVAYKNGQQAQGIEQIFVPGAFLVLFYLVIILLGNYMLTSTTEEKENRVIEIVLTSVNASSLIIGKILAMVFVGILQIVMISLPVIISLLIFGDNLNLPQINLSELVVDPSRLLIGAVLFIFSFLLFTGLLVTIGAVVPTAKEAGSFFGIAMFFMFIPLYALMAIVTDPSQMIVKVFSFFPLTAPITLLLRNAAGNLTTEEMLLGVAILVVSSILSLVVATRAFRYGTLEYERKLSFKRIFNG